MFELYYHHSTSTRPGSRHYFLPPPPLRRFPRPSSDSLSLPLLLLLLPDDDDDESLLLPEDDEEEEEEPLDDDEDRRRRFTREALMIESARPLPAGPAPSSRGFLDLPFDALFLRLDRSLLRDSFDTYFLYGCCQDVKSVGMCEWVCGRGGGLVGAGERTFCPCIQSSN